MTQDQLDTRYLDHLKTRYCSQPCPFCGGAVEIRKAASGFDHATDTQLVEISLQCESLEHYGIGDGSDYVTWKSRERTLTVSLQKPEKHGSLSETHDPRWSSGAMPPRDRRRQ